MAITVVRNDFGPRGFDAESFQVGFAAGDATGTINLGFGVVLGAYAIPVLTLTGTSVVISATGSISAFPIETPYIVLSGFVGTATGTSAGGTVSTAGTTAGNLTIGRSNTVPAMSYLVTVLGRGK